MRLEDMTPEMVEEAKKRESREERMAFIQENGIELTDEQLEGIAGGHKNSPNSHQKDKSCKDGGSKHKWVKTGRTRPGKWLGSKHKWVKTGRTRPGKWLGIFDDYEVRCVHCGTLDWELW